MRKLAIDDMRDFQDTDLICRTFYTGVYALQFMGPWDLLYLDHDLGAVKQEKDDRGRELNGSRLVDWLEEHPEFLPEKVILVTANAIGRQYMAAVLDKLMFRRGNEWIRDPNPRT